MVVDDQRLMRALIRSNLRYIGCTNVVECADGQEALSECLLRSPYLIISDMNMPNLDGLGLLRAVRNHPQLKATPFIMLTSRGDVAVVKQAMELGVSSYLVKPFSLVALKRKVEGAIGKIDAATSSS
jgi:two-component system chemotaxis response regulator CheY